MMARVVQWQELLRREVQAQRNGLQHMRENPVAGIEDLFHVLPELKLRLGGRLSVREVLVSGPTHTKGFLLTISFAC